jgi:hypothetical protein
MLTQGRLKEVLEYCPETGVFTWRMRVANCVRVGDVAGSLHKEDGYINIRVDGRAYPAQRLAWLFMTGEWPTAFVDHEDTVRSNNAWTNLRQATNTQNQHNAALSSSNTSGVKGVHWLVEYGCWRARVTAYGKRIEVGRFATLEDADVAIRAAREQLHGEFANHGDSPG